MTEPAAQRFNRLVSLVAECSRRESGAEPSYEEIATLFGVTPETILRDVRTLGEVADHAQNDGLLSLLAQEGDRVFVESRGAYLRPIRLTGEEVLAIKVALATHDKAPEGLIAKLAGSGTLDTGDKEDRFHPAPTHAVREQDIVDTVLGAIDADEAVNLHYASADERVTSDRRVDPHRIVSDNGNAYLLGWCHEREDWRRFRIDRVLSVTRAETARRAGAALPDDVDGNTFAEPEQGVDEAVVRFSPAIARWLAERYPSGTMNEDGSLDVTFHVASAEWLVRTVLQYGAEAEVIAPEVYREAVGRGVGK